MAFHSYNFMHKTFCDTIYSTTFSPTASVILIVGIPEFGETCFTLKSSNADFGLLSVAQLATMLPFLLVELVWREDIWCWLEILKLLAVLLLIMFWLLSWLWTLLAGCILAFLDSENGNGNDSSGVSSSPSSTIRSSSNSKVSLFWNTYSAINYDKACKDWMPSSNPLSDTQWNHQTPTLGCFNLLLIRKLSEWPTGMYWLCLANWESSRVKSLP